MQDLDYPVFVISLSDATARREKISHSLSLFGIPFSFFDAVDGRQGVPENMLKRVDRKAAFNRLSRDMTDGEIACALSHLLVYEHVVENKLPGAIILEDDAVSGKAFERFVKERCYLRKGMILFAYERARARKKSNEPLFEGYCLLKLALPGYLAVGYSIDFSAAQVLAAQSSPITCVADWSCDIIKLGAYAVSPPIICPLPGEINPSTLQSDRQDFMDNGRLSRKKNRWKRFFKSTYLQKKYRKWKRKYRKFISYPIPGSSSSLDEILHK